MATIVVVEKCRRYGICYTPEWIHIAIYSLAVLAGMLGLYIVVQFIRGEL